MNHCSANFHCLAQNVSQQAECKYFHVVPFAHYKGCGWLSIAKCSCQQARKEATGKLVNAVREQL